MGEKKKIESNLRFHDERESSKAGRNQRKGTTKGRRRGKVEEEEEEEESRCHGNGHRKRRRGPPGSADDGHFFFAFFVDFFFSVCSLESKTNRPTEELEGALNKLKKKSNQNQIKTTVTRDSTYAPFSFLLFLCFVLFCLFDCFFFGLLALRFDVEFGKGTVYGRRTDHFETCMEILFHF